MTPTHARRDGRLYRYYVAAGLLKGDLPPNVVRRVSAAEVEGAVIDQVRSLLRTPEMIIATWRPARSKGGSSEAEVREALLNLDPMWDELFPGEQTRVLQLLIDRVDVFPDGLDLKLRIEGLETLVAELRQRPAEWKAA